MRISVSDLVGNPGRTRAEARALTLAEAGPSGDAWGPADEQVTGLLRLDLQLESMLEGIYVHGTLSFDSAQPCAKCLEPVATPIEVDVAELFRDPRRIDPEDEVDEGYLIADDLATLDLETMLRDAVIMSLPLRVEHDEGDPACHPVWEDDEVREQVGTDPDERTDPRWAALAALDLDQDPSDG